MVPLQRLTAARMVVAIAAVLAVAGCSGSTSTSTSQPQFGTSCQKGDVLTLPSQAPVSLTSCVGVVTAPKPVTLRVGDVATVTQTRGPIEVTDAAVVTAAQLDPHSTRLTAARAGRTVVYTTSCASSPRCPLLEVTVNP